jgi:hypothetical protein
MTLAIPASSVWVENLSVGSVVASEYVYVLKNRNYRADGTVPGFVYCAGKSAGAWNVTGFGPAFELAHRGYPVICGDIGDTPTRLGGTDGPGVWGKDATLTKVGTYKTFLQGALGAKAGKIGVLYGSHGCAAAYGFAAANPTLVYCVAGAIGTCDVEDIRANNRGTGGGYQASIESAYTDNAGWQAARPTHNPVEVAASLSIPQLDYYSTDDPICVAATHAALLAAAGSNLTQVSLGAVGHATTGLGPPGGAAGTTYNTAFADWVEAHL